MQMASSKMKTVILPALGCLLGSSFMLLSPVAQASWNYRYFSGESFANSYWSSAVGTDSGGRVYAGMGAAGYGFSNYEYSASYDGITGYCLCGIG